VAEVADLDGDARHPSMLAPRPLKTAARVVDRQVMSATRRAIFVAAAAVAALLGPVHAAAAPAAPVAAAPPAAPAPACPPTPAPRRQDPPALAQPLPTGSPSGSPVALVVDRLRGHVIVAASNPATSLIVTNLDGAVVGAVPGQGGATGMAVSADGAS